MSQAAKRRFTETKAQVVDGWQYSVYKDGLVKVGMVDSGPYEKWTFRLTSFKLARR